MTWPLAIGVVVLSALCWLAATQIPPTGEAAPDLVIDRNPWTSTVALLGDLKSDARLWTGGLIQAWFWLVGAVALSLLPTLVKDHVGGAENVITVCLLVFTLGIAWGSTVAARASKTRPNMALVPVGALLMGLFSFDLAWVASGLVKAATPLTVTGFLGSISGVRILADLAGLAIAGGLYIVPAFAAVQIWAPKDRKARVIAACNVLSAAFMTGASLVVAGLQSQGFGLGTLFLVLGVLNVAAFVLVLRAWGRAGVQDLAAFIYRTFMGLEVKGRENLPKEGERAIIAPNHVSLLDASMMHAILPSHAAFAIDTGMANTWWVKPFLKLVKAEAIDPTKPLGTRNLINAVKGGETLVIFPEGRLT
ncbi:MAG: 1-acyl-sn-glycerol-3-phosphate acyltransferase, partial [Hyphomicrobium sp.]